MVNLGPTASPDDLRIVVRTATYPNAYEEQAAIADVEQSIHLKVVVHEQGLVNQAAIFTERIQKDYDAATDIRDALRRDVRLAVEEDPHSAQRNATRYVQLKRHAEEKIRALEKGAEEAEWHASRCDDVYASLCEMLAKYPALRNGRPL